MILMNQKAPKAEQHLVEFQEKLGGWTGGTVVLVDIHHCWYT